MSILAPVIALSCIVAVPVTFPEPSNAAEVQTTSPVIPIVLAVSKINASSAVPVKSPLILPASL